MLVTRRQLDAIKSGLAHCLIGETQHNANGVEPIYYPEEFLDIYAHASAAERITLFPLIDPQHYKRTYGVEPGAEQVVDFVALGPARRKWPHPLVRFDFAAAMRPDLTEDLANAKVVFDLLSHDLISLSPWLSAVSSVALKQLRRHELEPQVSEWVDPEHLRTQTPSIEDDWAAILHFASVQDAQFKTPTKRFDPQIWVRSEASINVAPELPFLNFLWHGKLEGYPSAPMVNDGFLEHRGLVAYSDWHIPHADDRRDDDQSVNLHAENVIPLPSAKYPETIAVALHVYYVEILDGILNSLSQAGQDMMMFVTTAKHLEAEVAASLTASGLSFKLYVVKNRGRDIAPFLKVLPDILEANYQVVLKLHTKKSVHRCDGVDWGNDLVTELTNPQFLKSALHSIANDPDMGFVGPAGFALPVAPFIMQNGRQVGTIIKALGLENEECRKHGHFFAGSMFVARVAALEPLLALKLSEQDFEPEEGKLDGTLAHALERVFMMSGWRMNQKMLIMGSYADNCRKKTRFFAE